MDTFFIFSALYALLVPAVMVAVLLLAERIVSHWIRILDDKTKRSRLRYAAAMAEDGDS